MKILVAGDSISHGFEHDYTWRYRLWEWFRHEHANNSTSTPALNFVGPYNGTNPNITAAQDGTDPSIPRVWGVYHEGVDPAFSPNGGSLHFALSGRPAWMDVELLPPQLAAFDPDLVILHMGFNDFGWWGVKPEELVESMRKLTEIARAQRPEVTVLISDVSGRLLVKGREDIEPKTVAYNKLLRETLPSWWRPESPVLLVPTSEVYDCESATSTRLPEYSRHVGIEGVSPKCVRRSFSVTGMTSCITGQNKIIADHEPTLKADMTPNTGHVDICPGGIDGLHPNSLGDFQIARAYTQVMHEHFGWGTGPLIVPPVDVIMAGTEASGAAEENDDEAVGNTGNTQHQQGHRPVAVAVGTSVGLCLVVAAVACALWWREKRRRSRSAIELTTYAPVPMEECPTSP